MLNKSFKDISPFELLPVGTPVLVRDDGGKVIKSEMVQASNGGQICLHTIKFTYKRIRTNISSTIKRINPAKVKKVNYSFIKAYF